MWALAGLWSLRYICLFGMEPGPEFFQRTNCVDLRVLEEQTHTNASFRPILCLRTKMNQILEKAREVVAF